MSRTALLCCTLILSGCSHMANDAWTGQDKAQHFIASAMLAAAGNEYAQHQGLSRDRSATIGLMFSISLERLELERFCLGRCRCHNRLYGVATGAALVLQA